MAHYAVGDIHGHRVELEMLLDELRFDSASDRLWCVGDLVNRGPDSVGVLKLLRSLGDAVCAVAGNHDLYLLAAAQGVVAPLDCLEQIQANADGDELLGWLGQLPLAIEGQIGDSHWLMTHAGVHPQWSVEQTHRCGRAVQRADPGALFSGAEAEFSRWEAADDDASVLAAACYCLTQMRQLTPAQAGVADHSGRERPWYAWPLRVMEENGTELLFGHWASLGGSTGVARVHALDTGCCWGGQLTALRLEDRRRFCVDSLAAAQFER